MIQAYPFKSAEILDLIFKTKLKGFPCNFVLIFFKKLKGLQVTGDPFNFKTPLHKNPCKTPVNPFKHLQCIVAGLPPGTFVFVHFHFTTFDPPSRVHRLFLQT